MSVLNDKITLTQRVNSKGETSKVHPQKPAIVIYDSTFLQYKLLEVIAPLICDWKDNLLDGFTENPKTGFDESVMSLKDLTSEIVQTFVTAINSSIECHDDAINSCAEMGVTLPYSAKALLRSFKLAKARNYKQPSDSSIED